MFRKIIYEITDKSHKEIVSDFLLGLNVLSVQIDEDEPIVSAMLNIEEDFEQVKEKVNEFLKIMNIPFKQVDDEIVEDKDWVEVFKQHFIPFHMNDSFYVVPDWEKGNYNDKFDGKNVIVIEPGQAFGTGLHPTTALASQLISEYSENKKNFSLLDAGTGSGILSICAMKKGCFKVLAFDVDPVCEESFRNHVKLNDLKMDCVNLYIGDEKKVGNEKFDLVVINIIEKIIREILPNLKKNIGDKLILSGLLEEHYEEFKVYLKNHNIKVLKELRKENWISLLCEKA